MTTPHVAALMRATDYGRGDKPRAHDETFVLRVDCERLAAVANCAGPSVR